MKDARNLLYLILLLNIKLRARHVSGGLNVMANRLFRKGQILPNELALNPLVCRL